MEKESRRLLEKEKNPWSLTAIVMKTINRKTGPVSAGSSGAGHRCQGSMKHLDPEMLAPATLLDSGKHETSEQSVGSRFKRNLAYAAKVIFIWLKMERRCL